ncbi:hypothetical protein GKQ38_00905 [Candidatus Nanohaloarchaea archaeon]|nr:hypothetical protein GKQ38_00905 [Candidatus Nanohaloarchaea archaeon]
MGFSAQELDTRQTDVEDLSELETVSHMYGLVQSYQNDREQKQLEKVYDQVKNYKIAKAPGTRSDPVEEGLDLWGEIGAYWDMTGKYDGKALAAATPILATEADDLGVNVEDAESLEELRDILDEGIDYFEGLE